MHWNTQENLTFTTFVRLWLDNSLWAYLGTQDVVWGQATELLTKKEIRCIKFVHAAENVQSSSTECVSFTTHFSNLVDWKIEFIYKQNLRELEF